MANLILKPSTGGVLKIQNDDGTVDALSVSTGGNLTAAGTLGVTGAVTASSTLGVTGNTTLAGTANNIGTVTAVQPPARFGALELNKNKSQKYLCLIGKFFVIKDK